MKKFTAVLILALLSVFDCKQGETETDPLTQLLGLQFLTQRTESLSAVAYGGNRFVAVGVNGSIYMSLDGTTWTETSSGQASVLRGVGYDSVNGNFAAVGNSGAILTSPDGMTWTVRNSAITDDLYSAVKHSTKGFWAVGENGRIISGSADGSTWVGEQSSTSAYTLLDILNEGGTLVAVGVHDPLFGSFEEFWRTSTNGGVNWSFSTASTTKGGRSVAKGGSTFVSVGNTGNIRTSSDGTTWTLRTSGTTSTLNGVVYNNGFVAVGSNGRVLTSSDGITWTAGTSPITTQLNDIAYGGGRYVAVGTSGVIMSSTDAVNWTQH